MSELRSASFDAPGETRSFDNGKAELAALGETTVGRFTFDPEWRWSESVKPIVGTDSCQNHHLCVAVSGRMHVAASEGAPLEIGPGDAQADLMAEVLGRRGGQRLVDVGSGRGWPGVYLSKATGCAAVLTDIPEQGLRVAKERAAIEGVAERTMAVVASARRLPFAPESF